jgi:hypothetical protein
MKILLLVIVLCFSMTLVAATPTKVAPKSPKAAAAKTTSAVPPKAAPTVAPAQSPAPSPAPSPVVAPSVAPAPVAEAPKATPFWKKWWFWTGIAALAGGLWYCNSNAPCNGGQSNQ